MSGWDEANQHGRAIERRPSITITQDHITLMQAVNWQWQYCEFGAPEIDPKRPYGNSGVLGDLKELLPHLDEDHAARVHAELILAIPAVLSVGTVMPGRYTRQGRVWTRVDGEVSR